MTYQEQGTRFIVRKETVIATWLSLALMLTTKEYGSATRTVETKALPVQPQPSVIIYDNGTDVKKTNAFPRSTGPISISLECVSRKASPIHLLVHQWTSSLQRSLQHHRTATRLLHR